MSSEIEAEDEIPNSYDRENPFILKRKLDKTVFEVREENADSKKIMRWKSPTTKPKITIIPKTGLKNWQTVYNDGISKIKYSLKDHQFHEFVDDEWRRIVGFGHAWDRGLALLGIAKGFYVVVKKTKKKNGKVYAYEEYILRPKGSALKAFKRAMVHTDKIEEAEVASKVASNLPDSNTSRIQDYTIDKDGVYSEERPSSIRLGNSTAVSQPVVRRVVPSSQTQNPLEDEFQQSFADSNEQKLLAEIEWLKKNNRATRSEFERRFGKSVLESMNDKNLVWVYRAGKDAIVTLRAEGFKVD